MTRKIAIDVGSGVTKIAWYADGSDADMQTIHFPTVAAEFIQGVPDDVFGIDTMGLVSAGSNKWAVGVDAETLFPPNQRVNTLSNTWAGSDGWMVVLYSAIASAFPDGGAFDLHLSTGLPQALYGEYRKALTTQLNRTHEFVVGDKSYEVTIKSYIVPQALAALMHEAKVDETLMDMQSAVIDIGTYTTGYAVLLSGRVQSWRSGGIEVGVSSLTRALSSWLASEKSLNIDPAQMPMVLRNGFTVYRGENMDLTDVIDKLATQVAKPIEDALVTEWGHGANDIARIIVDGGGASIYFPTIQRIIPHAVMGSTPDMAIVRGLLAFQG